jgi:hypothetical protein
MLFGECQNMNVSKWEHEQVHKIESFLEYFVNIKIILKKYSLTHDILYIMMWRNIYHVYMDER